MPTYDYRCKKCSHEFALFQGIKEKPRRTCPKCRGRIERLVTGGGGFILKGNGFYSTDHRSSDYKQAVEREKKSAEPKKEKAAEKKDKPAEKKSTEAAG